MADTFYYPYIGSGYIYVKEAGKEGAEWKVLANCSKLSFSSSEDSKKLTDFRNPGGGTYAEVRKITAIEINITMHDLNTHNLGLALYGSSEETEGAEITDEKFKGKKGSIIIPNKSIGSLTSLKLGEDALVEGTDYEMEGSGVIKLLDSSTKLTDEEQELSISYKSAPISVVEAFVNAGKEYELRFMGMNEATGGTKLNITVYRVKFGAAQSVDFIGEDFAALDVTGSSLPSDKVFGVGKSKYYRIEIAQP